MSKHMSLWGVEGHSKSIIHNNTQELIRVKQGGSVSKGLAVKAGDLSSIPMMYMVEGES